MARISIPKIISSVNEAYADAQQKYENWTGGEWLWKAPEYLITTAIARRIFDIDGPKYITIEHGASSAIDDAGAKGKGRLSAKIREKGKVDILLWWGDGSPRAVIEVKNQIFSTDQYKKDIERISSFLSRNKEDSSLQFGLFTFYESATSGPRKSAIEKVNDRIEKIFRNSIGFAGNNVSITKHISEVYQDDDSARASACLLIKPT
jgi:hypothetical protein